MNFNNSNIRKTIKKFWRTLKWFLISTGSICVILIILSFTTIPFWGYYWLGTSAGKNKISPEFIIVMGGSGIPGESGLIRSYYSATLGQRFPESKIIIALPGNLNDNNSSLNLMKQELTIRGVSENRILVENIGKNTRQQVLEIKKMISFAKTPIIVVTSPEHMRRSILSFEKAGLHNIGGFPAFEKVNEADLLYNDLELGGRNSFLPEIGGSIELRYQFWKHLEYEIIIIREFIALGFYSLKGWI